MTQPASNNLKSILTMGPTSEHFCPLSSYSVRSPAIDKINTRRKQRKNERPHQAHCLLPAAFRRCLSKGVGWARRQGRAWSWMGNLSFDFRLASRFIPAIESGLLKWDCPYRRKRLESCQIHLTCHRACFKVVLRGKKKLFPDWTPMEVSLFNKFIIQ